MTNSSSQQPLVLEYKERRFDGGTEKEMIENIELQHRIQELQRVSVGSHSGMVHPGQAYPMPHPMNYGPIQQQPQAPAAVEPRFTATVPAQAPWGIRQKLYKAFIMPYVELVLGLSGLLIGNIMLVTLLRDASLNPEVLREERKSLLKHSWLVVRNSVRSAMLSPFIAVKLLCSH